jgi:hypothetical protein
LIFQRCSLDLPLATVKIGDAFLVLELVFRLIFNLQSKNDNRTKKKYWAIPTYRTDRFLKQHKMTNVKQHLPPSMNCV